MGATEKGTSLADLAHAAERYGMKARGVRLPVDKLADQKLPLIALIKPGHYVLVDAAGPSTVSYWDPGPRPTLPGSNRRCDYRLWEQMWTGVALCLDNVSPTRAAHGPINSKDEKP
jgi:ABC-type bacteriocin/lantibiotic exporter with double-glycine peptidase domain